MGTRSLAFGLAFAMVCTAGRARGEDDPRRARAEALYAEGLRLHDADREAEALAKFKEAHAAYPSPNILVSLARTEQLLGRHVDALRHYREALKNPLLNPNHQALVRDHVKGLEAVVGRLRVEAPAGAKLAVDGAPLASPAPLRDPVEVDPGAHRVTATPEAGAPLEATVNVRAGEIATVQLRPAGAAPDAPTVGTTPPPSDAERTSPGVARWVVAGSLVGVGVAGLVGAGVVAASRAGDRDTLDAQQASSPGVCADRASAACAERQDLLDTMAAKQTTSLVLGVSGAALVAGGVVAFLVWPTSAARVAPYAGPAGGGLVLSGAF